MPMRDGFDPVYPLPPALGDQAEEQDLENACDEALSTNAWRFFKASFLIATAAAVGIAVFSVRDPAALVADVTASLVGSSSPQSSTDQSTPPIQSSADAPALIQPTVDAQASPPAEAKDPATSDTIAAAQPASRDETDKSESDALFRQFQAWAAEQNAPARVGSVQPVEDAPARAVQNAQAQDVETVRAPRPIMRMSRQARVVHNERAPMRTQKRVRPVRSARAAPSPPQDARAQDPRAQDPRAQDPSVQNAQTPSFLPIFGARN
jgi:hypothetical protein